MKKGLIRSISLLIVIALCLGEIQFTTFSESASQANFKQLSEWVEMADALLEKGTTYVEGKTAFDAAYDDAVSILEAGVADAGEIDDCIDDLKTAWAGLKFKTVTEIAPNDGVENDTRYDNFGDYYKVINAKQPQFTYVVNATGADFWENIDEIYIYAYAYKTDGGTTGSYIDETTLPQGNTNPDINYIYLSACNSQSVWKHLDGGSTYLARSVVRKFSFANERLVSKFTDTVNLLFRPQVSASSNTTMIAGSMFIVRSFYEQVPVSYELFKWINRAENLLGQGKTYTSGLDDFNAAIDAAKNATESDDADALISDIKTAWVNLVYDDITEIAPADGLDNDTGYANFGSSYKTASGKTPKIYYDINATGADFWADIEKVYVYGYGYYTGHATGEFISGTTLPIGEYGYTPTNNTVRLATPDYSKTASASSVNPFVARNAVKLFEFSKTKLQGFIDLGNPSRIMLCYMGDNTPDATLCAGSLFIFRGTHSENLPSDRIFTWIDRAEALLGSGVDFVSGLDDFNTAIAALYASNDPSQEQTLVDNLRTAWNNLCYEGEPVAIGYPKKEVGNDTTASYTSEDEKLGNHYIRVESNGSTMRVRIDCITDAGFPTEWFDDVIDIFFYTRGYQTDNSNQGWSSKWTNENVNTSIYFDGPNINYALSKFTVNKEKMLNKLNGSSFRNLMIIQGSLGEADTWIVGTLYASMKTKVNPADYGLADYGDLNGDETIDILDLVLAEEYIVGISDKVAAYSLDINEDDNYDESDFSLLLNIILQPI